MGTESNSSIIADVSFSGSALRSTDTLSVLVDGVTEKGSVNIVDCHFDSKSIACIDNVFLLCTGEILNLSIENSIL